MPPPAQQVFSTEFDRLFFRLPVRMQEELQACIDFPGDHLRDFRHQRLQGIPAFKLRVRDYSVIYAFSSDTGGLQLITLGHRREVHRVI